MKKAPCVENQKFWSFSYTEPKSQQSLNKPHRKKTNREPITYYELLELERQRNESLQAETIKIKIKRHFPIAPDGFIPNSVVTKFFRLFDGAASSKKAEKKIWKLKWKPPEVLKEENEKAATIVEPEIYNPQELYLDFSSDEELNVDEKETVEVHKTDSERFFNELQDKLDEYPWFHLRGKQFNVENVVTHLINKLIERNPANHSKIVEILIDILKNMKVHSDLKQWMSSQLEDELDGTDVDIICGNINLVNEIEIESYKIDSVMLDILANETNFKSEEIKNSVMDYFDKVCNVTEQQVELTMSNIKLFQNPKFKKLADFKLKKFIEDYQKEQEILLNKLNNVEEETESEIFNQIRREDWIADQVKENLVCLRDFLNLLLKSLKTVKSKIFYEKLANYLYELFKEFRLVNTNWEKLIVSHFIRTNVDSRVSEALRQVDLENISRYLALTQTSDLKSEMLVELLRSAAIEKSRQQVMENAKVLLKKTILLAEHDYQGLIDFFDVHSKILTNQNAKYTWQSLLQLYKTKSGITDQELLEIMGLSGMEAEIFSQENELNKENLDDSSPKSNAKSTKKSKKEKQKAEKKGAKKEISETIEDKNKTYTDKNSKESQVLTKNKPDVVVANKKDAKMPSLGAKKRDETKTKEFEHMTNSWESQKPNKIKESRKREFGQKDIKLVNESYELGVRRENVHKNPKKGGEFERSSQGRLNVFPNNVKGWEYYRKQSDREREIKDLTKHSLAEQHQLFLDVDKSHEPIPKEDYEKEYEKLKNQAEFEEDLEYDDGFDFDKIEVTSSIDSLLDAVDAEEQEDDPAAMSEHRRTTPIQTQVRSREATRASSRMILDGITRRVIMNQTPMSGSEFKRRKRSELVDGGEVDRMSYEKGAVNKKSYDIGNSIKQTSLTFDSSSLSWLKLNEKAHYIDTHSIGQPSPSHRPNLELISLNENRINKLIKCNKLLECLIIRQLELHDHYEKLLPPTSSQRDEFVQMPYFNDFLVVRPYNKNLNVNSFYQSSVEDLKIEQTRKFNDVPQWLMPPFSVEGETARIEFLSNSSVFPGPRRRVKDNEFSQLNKIEKARIGDLGLNHIYLINKLLVSYGAENIREFYSVLNSDLSFYLRRLNTRIPHKIIPLIWNDPVIQRLALILSTSYKLKLKKTQSKQNNLKAIVFPRIRRLNLEDNDKNSLIVTNSSNLMSSTNNQSDFEYDFKKFEKIPRFKKMNPFSHELDKSRKNPYNIWPVLKQKETPRTKAPKKKLYFHLMNSTHNNIRLQWQCMLQEENMKRSNLCFLPPLSLKINLNSH